MRVLEVEQQICPCYKETQEFQKLVELKDAGLVIYCHRPRNKDIRQAEAVESAVNTSSDVFILYNKKDVKITSSELTSELETKNISCPRCRKKIEHAQKLMQEVKSIDRKIVMGICDHCRDKATTTAKTIEKPFCACNEIVKKFINVKGEQKEDIKKYVKIWLSKVGLKDEKTLNKTKQIKTRAYSDLQISRGLNSPASIDEPEIQPLFTSEMHISDINLNTEMRETNLKEGHTKQAVTFFQHIEHVETTFAHTPHENEKINALIPSTLLEDSDTTFVETYVKELPRMSLKDRKQEEVFEDEPSIDAKEALKRRHDLSLRQMMRFENYSRVPYSVSKTPYIFETPKIAPWAQKEPTSKYHVESDVDIKIRKLKHDRGPRGTRDLDYVSKRDVKFRSTKPSQDSYYKPRKPDKYHHDKMKQGLYDFKEEPKKVKKSDQRVSISKSRHKKTLEHKESVGLVKKPQYSFFFPKIMEKEEKKRKLNVSSSHLIKDTQERFRLQAEREKKRQEEERQQHLEQAQKKKLAREEKKLQAEKEKKLLAEDNKYAEAQKIQQDKAKRDGIFFSESEQKGKISKESGVVQKDTKLEPDRIDEELDKAKKGTKSKLEQGDKIDNVLQKAKQDLKSKPAQGDKIDEILEKTKKDIKGQSELGDDDLISKVKKEQKKKHETRDKDDETAEKDKKGLKGKLKISVSEKPNKDFKEKSEQNIVEIEQKPKTEKEERDEKLQREQDTERLKQIEELRKDKEALKQQATKNREELTKEIKSSKKKRDSSEEIQMSMSKILKTTKKRVKDESANKQEILVVKKMENKEKEGKQIEGSGKPSKEEGEFKRLQAIHLKEKEEAFKKKKQLEYEEKAAIALEEIKRKAKPGVLKLRDIKMKPGLSDADIILRLVRIKQAASMNPSDIDVGLLHDHKCHHEVGRLNSVCALCLNSELELDVLSLDNKINLPEEKITDMIIGEKIFKVKRRLEKTKEPEVVPNLYQQIVFVESEHPPKEIVNIIPHQAESDQKKILSKKEAKEIEMEPGKGILRYALSDRSFIDKGWTQLPTEKVVRKMNVYRMRPAHPEFDWFKHNKNKRLMTYDSGERLAEFDDNGRGRWYYRNGRLALDYYDAEGGYLLEFYMNICR